MAHGWGGVGEGACPKPIRYREQGRGSTRALASHQYGPDSIPAWCHMWVEFVVGSRLASRVFLLVLWFPSFYKHQHFQIFQFDQDKELA